MESIQIIQELSFLLKDLHFLSLNFRFLKERGLEQFKKHLSNLICKKSGRKQMHFIKFKILKKDKT
jgi:hypothetical protein